MLGPVFRHEMLAAGRRRRYTLLRLALGLVLLMGLAIAFEAARDASSRQGGGAGELSIAASSQLAASFYATFAWVTLFGAVAVTPAIAAGAIASERERRTIEYLFATDLSNAEIVVDKLAARLLTVIAIAAAALPLLAIFRLMGGVPADLVLLHFAHLVTATMMVAAFSLGVSTWSERARDAVPRAYLNAFVVLVAPLFLAGVNFYLSGRAAWLVDGVTGPLQSALTRINPFWTLGVAGGVGGGVLGVDLDVRSMLVSMAAQLGVATTCLGVCVTQVRRVHLASSGRGAGKTAERLSLRRRPPPPDESPMLWKERYAARQLKAGGRGQAIAIGVVATALAGSSFAMLWQASTSVSGNGWQDYFQYAMVTIGFMGSIVVLLAGCRAAGAITYERERETWLSLLTTPLTGEEIVRAKLLGNLFAVRWALGGVVAIAALGLVANPGAWLAVLGVAVAVAVTAWAASAIGLWISLQMKSSVKAIGVTIAVLVGIGGGYLPFVAMFAALGGVTGDGAMIFFAPCVPFLMLAPMALLFEGVNGNDPFLPVYVIGVVGYTGLALMATIGAARGFDDFCQRGARPRWSHPAGQTADRFPDTGPPRPLTTAE